MDSNPIHHPSPAKKNEMLVFRLRSLLMICLADWWTWTPSATPLQPKKWNPHFCITFNFWWSARLVDGLKPHLPPFFSEKMKSSFLDYVQLLMINQAGQWTRTPSANPLQPIKWNFHYVQLLMISQAGQWTQNPSATPLQPIKWNASFWIVFTSDDQPGWLMDSNPICHPSPAKKMKCSFLDYIYFGWSARLVNGLEPHLPALFSQKKWNATFWITFNFWWSAGLVNGLKPHPPPVSSQKNEMLIFWLCSLQMIGRAGQWTWTPSTTLLQPKKWNPHFCITFNFWCWLDWSMDSNPICHPPQPKKWNPHFWIMFNFWWSARLVNGLEPHLPALSTQKSEMIIFGLHSTSDDWPGWLMDSNPIHHNSSVKKWNPHFWITFNFWWSARLVNGLVPHLPPLSSQKNEMLIFGLCSTSDYWPGRSMDSNPICQPSPTNKMKCSFLEYVQLLMISLGGWWTQTPSASPLQPKKWNATFWITFNFWWLAGLVNGLKPHPPPLSSQRNEMLIFVLCSTSNDQPGLSMDLNPIHHLSPAKKWNAHILIMFNFWWLAGLVNGLKPHPPPLSSQKKWNACF